MRKFVSSKQFENDTLGTRYESFPETLRLNVLPVLGELLDSGSTICARARRPSTSSRILRRACASRREYAASFYAGWVSAHDELRAAYAAHRVANLARYGPGNQPALGEPCATGRGPKFGTDAFWALAKTGEK
ncbi:hypothetical protein N7530_006744 [Penicillium desertorum]|uniref:Uncharacterized protein n=1 Tax=Penicillium desertorum TaxID=1303715 RepID=A0A9W9WSW8_9EURO|nr:hypothetical protein N7530_006744 [Penicillium desertorum]